MNKTLLYTPLGRELFLTPNVKLYDDVDKGVYPANVSSPLLLIVTSAGKFPLLVIAHSVGDPLAENCTVPACVAFCEAVGEVVIVGYAFERFFTISMSASYSILYFVSVITISRVEFTSNPDAAPEITPSELRLNPNCAPFRHANVNAELLKADSTVN